MASGEVVTLKSVEEAYERVRPYVKRTPVLTSASLNELTGKSLHFKCENLQFTGSFKVRGAINSILIEIDKHAGKLEGVVTESSGNHGQALAWAASKFNLKCVVVTPKGAPLAKRNAIEHYGGKLVLCDNSMTSRSEELARMAKELRYPVIHPHNAYNTMAGQGTIAVELLEQVPQLEAVIISIGGGGMSAGISAYIRAKAPHIKVFVAEPVGKQLQGQLESGVRELKQGRILDTIADGIRVDEVGDNCFPSLVKFVEKSVFTISEEEIKEATRLIWERLKLVVEPSAGLPLAAVLKYREELKDFKEIGLLLCGGNMNLDKVL